MQKTFEGKKQSLLDILHQLAVKHNRSYLESMIPIVERLTSGEEDVVDAYLEAIETDKQTLFASRKALPAVEKLFVLIP